jgi:hypothetical protein
MVDGYLEDYGYDYHGCYLVINVNYFVDVLVYLHVIVYRCKATTWLN